MVQKLLDLANITDAEIEQYVLDVEQVLSDIERREYQFFFVDFFCDDCFHKWNKDVTSPEDEMSLTDVTCPSCGSDNVTTLKVKH